MPWCCIDSESIVEILISNYVRMRIEQFPIGIVKLDSVIKIHGLWETSSAGNETLIRGNKGGGSIIANEL